MKLSGLVVFAGAIAALPMISHAHPIAGSCNVALDDGVASMSELKGPEPISMKVPSDVFDQSADSGAPTVVDLSLLIAPDGSVSSARTLCSTPDWPGLNDALLRAVSAWRFAPIGGSGIRATYRLVAHDGRLASRTFIGFRPAT